VRNISGYRVNEDAVIVGIAASGLWMMTTKRHRVRVAWALAKLAWRTLRHGMKVHLQGGV
jgi:hypothetical protein